MPPTIMNSMFLPDCTEKEISKIISELQNRKSSNIPISVIKKCSTVLSKILAKHFNHLMRIGEFPDPLKLGKIAHMYFRPNLNYRGRMNCARSKCLDPTFTRPYQ